MGDFFSTIGHGLATAGKALYDANKQSVMNSYMPLPRNIRRYGVQQNAQAAPTNPLGVGVLDQEVATDGNEDDDWRQKGG